MKTKGLLETLPELVVDLIKGLYTLIIALTRCLWLGHDLDKKTLREVNMKQLPLPSQVPSFIMYSYSCKHCGLRVELKEKINDQAHRQRY